MVKNFRIIFLTVHSENVGVRMETVLINFINGNNKFIIINIKGNE